MTWQADLTALEDDWHVGDPAVSDPPLDSDTHIKHHNDVATLLKAAGVDLADLLAGYADDLAAITPHYYRYTTSAANVVLPAGTYKCRIIAAGAAGGGSAASDSDYSVGLIATGAHSVAESLSFDLNGTNGVYAGMTVTGAGITGLVGVYHVEGTLIQLISFGGSIGTLTTSGYTFKLGNGGGGGATGTNHEATFVSDGVTPYNIIVGAGGLGVTGADGNYGNHSYITDGPDEWVHGITGPWSPAGGPGALAASYRLGWAGQLGGPYVTDPSAVAAAFQVGGTGGCRLWPLNFRGVAAGENPLGGVGGGAGGPHNGVLGGSGGDKGTVTGAGGPGHQPGTTIGAWAAATVYAVSDVVTQSGSSYVCISAHTSSAAGAAGDQPGIGATYGNVWMILTGTSTGANGVSADANSGCGGGGAGGSAPGGSAAKGGDGGSGLIEIWKIA